MAGNVSIMSYKNQYEEVNLVDAEPFADAFAMVYMFAWQFRLPISYFIPHLTDHASVFAINLR